jgi:hypothetical protein
MGNGAYYPEINGGLLYDKTTFSSAASWLSVKKGITGSVAGNPPGTVGRMNSALDNYMMRLAEVYMNYAEAILGNSASTSDPTALQYFNAVRTRAGMPAKTSVSWNDIRHERRIEFCLEGRYWFDLLSRAYYKQQDVITYLSNQNRGTVVHYLFDTPSNLRLDPSLADGTRSAGTPSPGIFLLPYPQSEIVQNPKLSDPPVNYTFTEDRITDLFN